MLMPTVDPPAAPQGIRQQVRDDVVDELTDGTDVHAPTTSSANCQQKRPFCRRAVGPTVLGRRRGYVNTISHRRQWIIADHCSGIAVITASGAVAKQFALQCVSRCHWNRALI